MELPKLKRITENQKKRPKILLLSDDILSTSGIGTMSKTFVLGTADKFNWVQLAAALNHPDHGKVADISEMVNKETGLTDSSVKLYLNTGYGNEEILRHILEVEKPDAILHFTDPRFWDWLYAMEYSIHQDYKIPIMYYAIWDNFPYPYWNASSYSCCDLIMAISKQSHLIHKKVLDYASVRTLEVDQVNAGDKVVPGDVLVKYVPHGIDGTKYFPILEGSDIYEEYKKFKDDFETKNNSNFVIFWTNRNVRRKQPGDVMLAYRIFLDSLPKEDAKKCVLFMHTSPIDENGTDLFAVKRAILGEGKDSYKVIFSVNKLEVKALNFFYNLADVTLNIASNEGFGLSSAESLMAGTMVINNVTGGLQDQMRFEEDGGEWYTPDEQLPTNHGGLLEKCGEWAIPVFPSNRSLQGSLATPYILDDRACPEDVAEALMTVYNMSKDERRRRGGLGAWWMRSDESQMEAQHMSNNIAACINACITTWKPKPKIELIKVNAPKKIVDAGITITNKATI